MRSVFFVYAVCAFASGIALRTIDPLIVPIAQHFAVAPATAALLSTAYALPYAIAQPFLGPLGDRFGKARCVQICVAGLALMLAAGTFAPGFEWLMASRILAGVFAGGLVPLVIAGIGDAYELAERQVMIGRMLFAIITGQMLGSMVAGQVNVVFGWRSALGVAALVAVAATLLSTLAARGIGKRPAAPASGHASFRTLYGRVFENPKAIGLYGAVIAEGALVFGLFPFVGQLLIERTGTPLAAVSSEAGLVLGAFGVGGLLYALSVRRLIATLGVRRMCAVGALVAGLGYAALIAFPVWWLDALALGIAGLAYYMLHNSLQTEAPELAPSARGSAVALFACGFFVGQAVGPLVFGALVRGFGFPTALVASSLGLIALGQYVIRRIVPAPLTASPG